MRFQNKTVLITGAGGGIGRATAVAFAAEGASLVLADLKDELRVTAEQCRDRGAVVHLMQIDVASNDAPVRMVQTALDAFGRLDVAFNNAGIAGVNVDVADYPDDVWDQVMNVNVRAVFRAMKAQIRVMRAQGGGTIVNTASLASFTALKMSSGYIAAKHAVMGLTKAAALDAITDGIRINAVCPGIIDTPLLEHGKKIPGLIDSLKASVPNGRLGQPEEVARAVLFLASGESSYMVGQGMVIDGGVSIV